MSKDIKTQKIIALVAALLFALSACSFGTTPDNASATASSPTASSSATSPSAVPPSASTQQQSDSLTSSDDIIAELFKDQESGVQIRGEGVVLRLLSDDNDGDRHQRFILELSSGQTLLIAHNIDIAPRLNGITVGDRVEFFGEYFYNEQGGGVHWTHHDPGNKHIDGWLLWNGVYYG